eukprot:SAG31_NODE_5181_length_2695_cov_1.832435_3_plen_101_part_00
MLVLHLTVNEVAFNFAPPLQLLISRMRCMGCAGEPGFVCAHCLKDNPGRALMQKSSQPYTLAPEAVEFLQSGAASSDSTPQCSSVGVRCTPYADVICTLM